MTGYTKLFGSIITSTIWREDKETKILWITMLALKNKAGIVEGSVPGLSDMARLSLAETIAALKILSEPDEFSRTKEFEGRRIQDVDGGWLILNHKKWRDKMNADERREYLRIKQAEHRARQQAVNKRKQKSTLLTHTYEDTDTKKKEGANGSRPQSVEDWLKELEVDKTYSGIDVRREYGKMLNWCKIRKKKPTQRRFVNWLNNAERPFTLSTPTSKNVYGKQRPPPINDKLTDEQLAAERARVRDLSAKLRDELKK
jgi:hypothetical protein